LFVNAEYHPNFGGLAQEKYKAQNDKALSPIETPPSPYHPIGLQRVARNTCQGA